MRTLWRLLLTGRVKSRLRDLTFTAGANISSAMGLPPPCAWTCARRLTPCVSLREPFRWPAEDGKNREPEHIKDLVEWEIVLSTDHVHSSLRDLPKDDRWTAALPELLSDFSALLRDALDLMRELGSADGQERSVLRASTFDQSEHSQNKDFHDWTALIDLTRDAWLATAQQSPERGQDSWRSPGGSRPIRCSGALRSSLRRRDVVIARLALDWLLADDHWWLWSVETEREAMRLLVALAPHLDEAMLAELEQAILCGPPRDDVQGRH